ncbi:MAG: hypothetical protein U5L09_03130 [Bacteroidales bacterium]|nr:hypothetical protein [Bacteroidales bacterium]
MALQVMNEYGCRDTLQEPITVYRVPEAVIGHDSSCYMQPTQFYDLSDTNEYTGEIIAWQWDFGVEGTAADHGGYCRAGVHVREPRQPHGDPAGRG